MTYETELSRKLIRDLAGVELFKVCRLLGPVPVIECTGRVGGTANHSSAEAPPTRHSPNTESMRCSCKAPLCSKCGWCAATCGCYDGHALEVELRKRRIPDAREVDLERQSGCFDEE